MLLKGSLKTVVSDFLMTPLFCFFREPAIATYFHYNFFFIVFLLKLTVRRTPLNSKKATEE